MERGFCSDGDDGGELVQFLRGAIDYGDYEAFDGFGE